MKRHCFTSYPLFALIGLMLSPLAVVHASTSPADSVHFCAPFDYEQWRREHPRPAGKRLADLDVGEPRTVRMIYFLPKGRPYDAAVVDTIKTMMRRAQDWFAEQMEAHGYDTRIHFEADDQGEPLVHRVDGQHRTKYYNTDGTVDKVLEEINPVFDLEANVYYVAIDNGNSTIYSGDLLVGGVGSSWSKKGGWFLVPSGAGSQTVVHELGHAFGLSHDFRDGAYIMSYGAPSLSDMRPTIGADGEPRLGGSRSRLSACNAEFLAVHPYFNANIPIEEGSWPAIEERTSSPIQTAGATSIPVRIKVRDPDELHQAILFTRTQAPHFAEGSLEVKACRGLEGRRNPVVEFDYDGTVPSFSTSDFYTFETQELVIGVVDALGDNDYSEIFELVNNEFRKPISTLSNDWPRFFVEIFFSGGRLLALEASWKDDDDKVKLWDVATGRATTLPRWGPIQPWFSRASDGRLLALESSDGEIKLWDVSSRKSVASIDAPHEQNEDDAGSGVSSLAFSPDGSLLATGGRWDALVKLWDIATGEPVATFSDQETISSLVFSPDGSLLAAYGNGTVMLYDVANRKRVEIDAHERGFAHGHREVAFSPDSKLLATGGEWGVIRDGGEVDTEVKLWDVASRELVATLWGSTPLAFSPDGSLLASALPIKTRWFDIEGLGRAHSGWVFGGEATKLWDASTGKPIATLSSWSRVYGVVFSPDGRLLAERTLNTVRLWDVSGWIGQQATTTAEQAPHTLTKVSGDGQEGMVGTALAKPFVVSVLDQEGSAFAGAVVTFSVTAGGGTLSSTTATTDANGRAKSTLTLGDDPGTNTVTVVIEGLEPETFTAIGQATTDSDSEEDDSEEDDGEDQESEETPTSTVELKGISASHDSVRENDAQATTITLTVTLDKAARTDETITLALVSPTQGKTAKRGEDFDATLDETITIAKGQRTGTAQLILTPKDNTTADGDKAFAVQATSSSGHAALINIKIIDNDSASEPQAWLTPDPAEVEFSADDPVWKTFTVHTNLDSVLVRANPPGSDPAIEVSGGQQVPTRDYCPAEGNDRPTSGRRDGWNLHVKACQAGQTKILLIDYDTDAVLQQYEVNVEASTSAAASTALNPSYPNPFNSETVLSYTLPTASAIRLEVFALNGQRVAVLHEGFQAAGYHTIAMDASDLASGVYLYRLTTPEGRFVQKFTLLR